MQKDNLDILWKTVIEDLPPLITELEKIVPPGKTSSGLLKRPNLKKLG